MAAPTRLICAACAEVATLPGHVEPHRHMQLLQKRARRYPDGAADTYYRCLECDTVWTRHTDKWGASCGFKLVSGGE